MVISGYFWRRLNFRGIVNHGHEVSNPPWGVMAYGSDHYDDADSFRWIRRANCVPVVTEIPNLNSKFLWS